MASATTTKILSFSPSRFSGMLKQLVLVSFVGFMALAHEATKPPPPIKCGSKDGPPLTAPRIQLKDGRHKELGVPKDNAKHKIMYIHGFDSSRHGVTAITGYLSPDIAESKGIYIVSFDRPGYGESDPNPSQTVGSISSDIEELADRLGLGSKFFVVGFSLGGQIVWTCLKYIPHRLAGAALIAPVVNYWWEGIPSNLSVEAYKKQLPEDQWGLRVAHYLPWLSYWWNTRKLFPSLSLISRSHKLLSRQDVELMPRIRSLQEATMAQARQQGEFESLHRDLAFAFGRWDFDPTVLRSPFAEGSVHLWQGDEDIVVPATLQRHIALRLPWIDYHEQGKDEESDGGERRCNEHDSEDEALLVNSKEKSCRVRKRKRKNVEREGKAEVERDEEKEKKSARKNDDEALKSQTKEPELTKGEKCSVKKVFLGSKKSNPAREIDPIKILVDSIDSFKEKKCSIDENALAEDHDLPLRFRFEDDVELPREKPECEKHLDSLFCDLELGLRESENDCTNTPEVENDEHETGVEVDESPAAACLRGDHNPILDEEIGIVCLYCHAVIMEIKHVLPPFHEPKWGKRDKRYYYDEYNTSVFTEIPFEGSSPTTPDSAACTKGTVWDLIPGVQKELYPHQRSGFEFMWRNIGGDIVIEKLKQSLADDARGCIISHAPGTGKTRLTIIFLQTFMKLYPSCCPMIIAPKGMLLTWEAEFKKWNFNAAFHNVNTKELSGKENVVASELVGQFGNGKLSLNCIRLLKLYSWSRGGSILGISYSLFEKLAGENGGGMEREKIREVLLERPDLLVLDEGHTPRNNRSLIWKALTKVSTLRRIILSGTPFQNNLRELYNTLCVVNPKYADQESNTSSRENYSVARRRWKRLTNSNGINRGSTMKLRAMLDPFVHVHKGTILEESLPGLSHTLVFLHPTETQKKLLESACKENDIFRRIRMVSLISVHPLINAVKERYFPSREESKFDIDEGVKARFLLKLINFSDALEERVLVFSQFIDSLVFIKEQLESVFPWKEGREVLYMDGQLEERKRQESISCFNDEKSEAKVLLASERACSEGINLIGASRVVLLDTVWNPLVEKQAISRTYRIGQKKMVYVYRLFTPGIEVRQYAKQNQKERISQWIFALGEGQSEKVRVKVEDKVLDGMVNLENFKHILENIISQPTQSDLIKTCGPEKKN